MASQGSRFRLSSFRMKLSSSVKNDAKYAAMLSRDARFDGRFFIGVKTTGIYCRPICPARPKRVNVEFYQTALAAERAGFRPCLRCRPECAPGSPAWMGTSAVVSRALKRIASGERIDASEAEFAATLGVSARHLRRLFKIEIGKSPKQIADEQRLGFARQLVVETDLPFTKVAEGAGFASLRRFNSSFKERFGRSPSELRKRKATSPDDGWIELRLAYRPPLDFSTLLDFHRRHVLEGLEEVGVDFYRRLAVIDGSLVLFEVAPIRGENSVRLRVRTNQVSVLFPLARRVRKMFDLDSDPLSVDLAFARDPRLKKLTRKRPGLRVTCGFDPYETAFATVLGQLVSVERANQLVSSLRSNYGRKLKHPLTGQTVHSFPSAAVLAKSDFTRVGTTGARKNALRSLAHEIETGRLRLDGSVEAELVKEKLLAIPGIGPWTAEYVALRALGDTDAFPEADLILKRASTGANAIDLDPIRPWRSYAAIHLWKEHA